MSLFDSMDCIDLQSRVTSTVIKITNAFCGFFCVPFYEEIRTTVEVILHPQSLDEDSDKLKQLLDDVTAMNGSEAINEWIGEAKQILCQIEQLQQLESGSSSNHNDDHQSSCLCSDACFRCHLHRNIKKMIARGDQIFRCPSFRPESVEEGHMLNDGNIWCIGVQGPGGTEKRILAKALNIGEGIENQIRSILQREKFGFVDNKEIKLPKYEKDYSSVATLVVGKKMIVLLPNDNLTTLLNSISAENLEVSTEFVNGFGALKALNMVGVNLLVASLRQLEELHALTLHLCNNIEEVIAANKLMIHDLSFPCIHTIPRGMKEFSYLKVLKLTHTFHLQKVDADAICNLPFLEVLDMSGNTGYRWPIWRRSESEEATLQDLSRLRWLREVHLQLDDRYANRERERKFFVTNTHSENTEIESFVLYADKLCLYGIKNVNVSLPTDPSNPKPNPPGSGGCNSRRRSTPTVSKYLFILSFFICILFLSHQY